MRTKKVKRQQKWEQENQKIQACRARAAEAKAFLRSKGCDLRFYDYLDSYSDEFQRIVVEARNAYRSLLNVHELDDAAFRDTDWSSLGYGDLKQIVFHTDDEIGDYAEFNPDANLSGYTCAFHDAARRLRTVILIRRTVRGFEHKEFKYACKIPALLHELGHVHDIENGTNFDVQAKTVNLAEAEAFANLYALEKLAERHLVQSYRMLADALRAATTTEGHFAEVARRVISRLPNYKLALWSEHPEWKKATENG
jgi:hypothetical protein